MRLSIILFEISAGQFIELSEFLMGLAVEQLWGFQNFLLGYQNF